MDSGFAASRRPGMTTRIVHAAIFREVICPTGGVREFVSSPFAKNKSLRDLVETALLIPLSRLAERGVSRSSRTWMRDAVDVTVSLTYGAEADGEVVWS